VLIKVLIRIQSSGMLPRVDWPTRVWRDRPEDGSRTLLQKSGNYFPIDMVYHQ